MEMTTEYFKSSISTCSNSFESCKRRRIFSGDFKNSECDNECLMDYTAESSTKASSSSIQESITNMSNSYSTPEDNCSENALSSPFSKMVKHDCDKDLDTPSDQYSRNPNGIYKSLSVSSNNSKSIDDTIESVLSKIREENNTGFIKSSDSVISNSETSTSASIKSDQNNISISISIPNGSQSVDNQYSKAGFPVTSYNNLNTQSLRTESGIFNNNYSASNFNKNHLQQFYNYGNYYSIPTNFSNQMNLSNYNRPTYCKDSDKSNILYQYQCQNPSYRTYMPNSFVNQQYYRQEPQNISVQPSYQLFQKPLKRDSSYDQIIMENELNLQQQSYGINFKTPQSGSCGFYEQTIRKKRPIIDQNKLTPTKKRKLINQISLSNNYEDLLNKLKTSNHNSLLMNPSLPQSKWLLPPLEFVESKTSVDIILKPIKYEKYKSLPYFITKPKRLKDQSQSDGFLANYVMETISGKVLLSDKCNADGDNLSDIVCMTPDDDWRQPSDLLSQLHNPVDVLCDPSSPQLSTFRTSLTQTNSQNAGCDSHQICDFNALSNHPYLTSVVAYSDSEAKLITQLQSFQERDPRSYSQLSGSFLKRTKINGKSFSNVHIEEAVSVASLAASKHQNTCRHCCMFLTGLSCLKRYGRKSGQDSSEELLFCSNSCYSNFLATSSSDCKVSPAHCPSNQVLIKTAPYKPPKSYKKVSDFEQYVRRRFPSEGQNEILTKSSTLTGMATVAGESVSKPCLGINYWYCKSDMSMQTTPLYNEIGKEDQMALIAKYSCAYRCREDPSSIDARQCVLCQGIGDGDESVCGRLMNLDSGTWIHLNCGLWCFDVFETVSGSLMGVQLAVDKAIRTRCSSCNEVGAGLQCYWTKCSSVYHVPCAHQSRCVFYTDRGMYCPVHAVLNHPMHLTTLTADRRVNVWRDESALVAEVVLDPDNLQPSGSTSIKYLIRTGTLTLVSVRKLLPDQLLSGRYNSSSIIYPVGYHATRIYWSSTIANERCQYHCHIDNGDDTDSGDLGPMFRIVYRDRGESDDTVVRGRSCDGLWQTILSRIARLRHDRGLTRLFPAYLSGEQLYGLTEPHIVRVIESLPGMEMITNYAFKFGRMQLIAEMPLAVNPTGSARTEPKLRTFTRRSINDRAAKNLCSVLRLKSSQQSFIYDHKAVGAGIDNSRSQQYMRLRSEWFDNIILSRSKIQGLGLFAAKDLEKATMIIEYIGETIRNEVANRLERLYQSRNNSIYMFRLSEDIIIDATVRGGLARYMNHSCSPNCQAEYLSLDSLGAHIVISTKQRVDRGEELTYDYKFDFEDSGVEKIPCLCGALNCRRWMN